MNLRFGGERLLSIVVATVAAFAGGAVVIAAETVASCEKPDIVLRSRSESGFVQVSGGGGFYGGPSSCRSGM